MYSCFDHIKHIVFTGCISGKALRDFADKFNMESFAYRSQVDEVQQEPSQICTYYAGKNMLSTSLVYI